jgi:hypothetical protein
MKKGKTLAHLKGTTVMNDAQVAPVENAEQVAGIIKESRVDILYMRTPLRKRIIRVKVHSQIRPNLVRYTDVAVDGNSQQAMTYKVSMAAGAIAEQLIALYGDTVEPGECARAAEKHFSELCSVLAKQNSQEASV